MTKRILIIDDEQALCDLYQSVLIDTGYSVETALTGEEGIQKAIKNSPDLVFLDLGMPGIGGVETLRRLSKIYPDVPVYIVTALQRNYMRQLQQVSEEGVIFEICNKPVEVDHLLAIANSILKTKDEKGVIDTKDLKETIISLKLYIAGKTAASDRAVQNVKRIVKDELRCKCDLKIVDILEDPKLAEQDNIVATPTLVRVNPPKNRIVIGDLSDSRYVCSGLGLL